MKNFVFAFLTVSILSCKAQPKQVKTSLLWEVSGKGIAQPSYLFGTMHLLCDSDLVVTEPLKKAFDKSKELYLELDMDDAGMLIQSMMGMMMKNGESLENLLPRSTYDSVIQKFTSLTGMQAMMINKIKPMLTSAMIYPPMLGCAGQGWDMKFAEMAKQQKKEITGLEEVKDQIAVFDSIPYKEQAQSFASMILNLDSTKQTIKKLLETYRKKDIDAISEMTDEDSTTKKYESILLANRNNKWIPKIETAVKQHVTFVAVGAAHLGGKDGVINLLRKKGYIIKPVAY